MKKKILFLVIVFIFGATNINFAQKNVQARIDSLETVLKTVTDTNKIFTLLHFCSAYQQTDPNKVSDYLNTATELANELKIPKWIAECFYTKGLYEYGKGNFSAAKKNYQEALILFEQEKNQIRMGNMKYSIGVLEVYTGNYAQANECFFKTLKIYEILDKKDLMSNCYSAIGNVYGRQGNSQKEEEFHLKALNIRLELKDNYGLLVFGVKIS